MQLKNIGEVRDFLGTVDRCAGEVWLEDREGSKINLKSKLSQYVAIGALLSEQREQLYLYCQLPEDDAKFYVLFSENPEMGV